MIHGLAIAEGYYVLRVEYQRNVEALATLVNDDLARNDYIKLRQIECKERIDVIPQLIQYQRLKFVIFGFQHAKLLEGWLLKVDKIQQQKSVVLYNHRQHE